MPNTTVIDKLIAQSAINDLKVADEKLQQITNTYINLIKVIGEGLNFKPTDLTDLAKKAKDYDDNMRKLQDTVLKLESISKDYEASLNRVTELQRQSNSAVVEAATANKLNKEAVLAETKTIRQESQVLKENTQVKLQDVVISKEVKSLVDATLGTREQNIHRIAEETSILKNLANERKRIDNLEKQGAITYQEAIKQRVALIDKEELHKQAKSQLIQIVSNETKSIISQNSSLDAQRLQLERLKKAYAQLSEAERNSGTGQDLLKNITDLKSNVDELSGRIGNFQSKVGDYEGAIKRALSSIIPFGDTIISLGSSANSSAGAFKNATVAVSAFGKQLLALLANPVVLILSAIAASIMAISQAINSSEELTNRWNVAMAPLNRALDFFLNIIQKGAGYILSFVENAMGMVNAISVLMEKLPFLGEYFKQINDANKEAIEIEKERISIEKQSRQNEIQNAKDSLEVAKLRKTAKDRENKTTKERLAAIKKANEIEEAMAKRNVELAERRLKVLEIQAQWAGNSAEANEALAKQQAEVYRAEQAYFSKTMELAEQENSLRNEIKNERKKQIQAERQLEDARLAALDESIEKERKKLILSFNRRIQDIKLNGENVVELTKAIEEEKIKVLEAFDNNRLLEIEKVNADNRLAVAKKGSDEELRLRLELLEMAKQKELKEAEKTGVDKLAIEAKYNKLVEDEYIRHDEEIIKLNKRAYDKQLTDMTSAMKAELVVASKQYAKGKLDKEQYEKEKLRIQQEYALKTARLSVEAAEAAVNILPEGSDARLKAEEELSKARINLSNLETDIIIENNEKVSSSFAKWYKKNEKYVAQAAQTLSAISELGNTLFEGRIQNIENEQEANEEASEAEIERIEKLAETGVISTEEAEARKRAAEEKTAQRNKELEKRKAELQVKQAKWQKANSIVQTIIATSLAIMQAMPNVILAALVGAMGALQLAAIIAQPIPKYAKGTDDHPGGLAVVGDGGKSEGIVIDGKIYRTPAMPTLVNLPAGAMVLPDLASPEFLNRCLNNEYWMTHNEKGEPVQIINNFDTSVLERESVVTRKEITTEIRNLTNTIRRENRRKSFDDYIRRNA